MTENRRLFQITFIQVFFLLLRANDFPLAPSPHNNTDGNAILRAVIPFYVNVLPSVQPVSKPKITACLKHSLKTSSVETPQTALFDYCWLSFNGSQTMGHSLIPGPPFIGKPLASHLPLPSTTVPTSLNPSFA